MASDAAAAARDVMQAGQAGVAAVRQVAATAGERAGTLASIARRQVGETAEAARERVAETPWPAAARPTRVVAETRGIARRLLTLPRSARRRAERARKTLEAAAARAAVSVLRTGTKMLSAAAEYVSPRRRVAARAVQQLVVEQLDWAHTGTEAYDRAIAESEDTDLRMRLVRYKLQTIKQAETLGELLREIGGTVPPEERATAFPSPPGRNGAAARGPKAVRQGLAHALTVAVQSAEGWRALDRIAAWAEQDRVATAIVQASEAVGSEPREQVEFLSQALLDATLEMVTG